MRDKKRVGCLKGGCFGVLGCTGLFVVAALVVLALRAAMGVPQERLTNEQLEQALPSLPPEQDALAAGSPATSNRVILDMGIGELEIEPGPAGEPIRVEGDFDASQFELVDEFDPGSGEGWEYRISMGRAIAWFRQRFDDEHVRVRIVLPRDVPFALEGKIGIGESRIDLGGLWLTDVDLSLGTGSHRVSFDEPLRQPLGLLRLRGKVGETSVDAVGNASPKECRIGQRLGELRIDLDGEWRQDADVDVGLRIGELSVSLPDEGVRVELEGSSLMLGERDVGRAATGPSDAPLTMRLNASNGIGELRISR